VKVISIFLAVINTLFGGLLILSCVSASEALSWVVTKSTAGFLGIFFGILTFTDNVQPINPGRMLLINLALVIIGISGFAWGIHWSIISGDVKNTVLLFGGSLFIQGLTSMLGMSGSVSA
jgi:hypothetical protein